MRDNAARGDHGSCLAAGAGKGAHRVQCDGTGLQPPTGVEPCRDAAAAGGPRLSRVYASGGRPGSV